MDQDREHRAHRVSVCVLWSTWAHDYAPRVRCLCSRRLHSR
jgi:hypothetical protein